MSDSAACAVPKNCRPVSVSTTPLRTRWNSLLCNCASSTAIEWLTALAVRLSSFAAREMLRLREVASKASSALRDGSRFGLEPPKLGSPAARAFGGQVGAGGKNSGSRVR